LTNDLDSLNALLDESIEHATRRAEASFDLIAGPLADKLVLFGAGNFGRKTLDGLRQVGVEPLAFVDNDPLLWGTSVDGLPVLPPNQAITRFKNEAAWVITIWNNGGGHQQAEVCSQLWQAGAYPVTQAIHLFWKHPAAFLPHYGLVLPQDVLQQSDLVRQAFSLFDDEESRRVFVARVRNALWPEFYGMEARERHFPYFPPDLIALSPDERFVDCGAFDGDTLREFVEHRGSSFQQYIGFEPDERNHARLVEYANTLPADIRRKLSLCQMAVGGRAETVGFVSTGNWSRVAAEGDNEVICDTIDSLLGRIEPTFIKMNIEGGEAAALLGARRVIESCTPTLSIVLDHRPNDLWKIPILVSELSDWYKFTLRLYSAAGWFLMLYAVKR